MGGAVPPTSLPAGTCRVKKKLSLTSGTMVQLKIIFLFILPRQTPSVLHIHFHNLLLWQGVA